MSLPEPPAGSFPGPGTALAGWTGPRRAVEERLGPGPAGGLAGLFDRDPIPEGDPLPPLWHWAYFPEWPKRSAVGPDGHPLRGDFLPPVELPRRMFAGGRAEFLRPLRVGEVAVREGRVVGVRETTGRSGPLVFVTVRYELSNPGGLAVVEEQDLVYREVGSAATAPEPPPSPPPASPWEGSLRPDPVLLFRFSALTANGHRIHYDRPYATEVEGYPGLVVHGPLVALCLLELARAHSAGRPIARFAFRARRPLFDHGRVALLGGPTPTGDAAELAAYAPEGGLAMTAEVTFGPADPRRVTVTGRRDG